MNADKRVEQVDIMQANPEGQDPLLKDMLSTLIKHTV